MSALLAKALHLALAALVLTSATGVRLQAHYCGGRLVDWSVSGPAGDCGMPQGDVKTTAEAAAPTTTPHVERVPCCQDTDAYLQADFLDAPQTLDAWDASKQADKHFPATVPSLARLAPPRRVFAKAPPTTRPPPPGRLPVATTLHRLARLQTFRI